MTEPSAYISTGGLPSDELVRSLVVEAYERFGTNRDGSVSTVYPALARVDPAVFGICVVARTARSSASATTMSRSRS